MLLKQHQPTALHTNQYQLNQLLDQKCVATNEDMTNQIALLMKRYEHNHKWLLVISNNANEQMHFHQKQGVCQQNVLWVHANKVNVSLDNIKRTLIKGNCAAVALCNVNIDEAEVEKIASIAVKGNTHCVLLNQSSQLH